MRHLRELTGRQVSILIVGLFIIGGLAIAAGLVLAVAHDDPSFLSLVATGFVSVVVADLMATRA